jgi:transcriptional regulator with XRE-family HTH domain
MGNESFGNYIRRLRIEKNLPLRKVAAQLDIDTSTLSKVERGDRPISIEYLKPLSEILLVELKEIQVHFITDTIFKQLGQLEFIAEGLKSAQNQMKEK